MSSYNHFAHHKDLVGYATSKKVPMAGVGIFISGILLLFGGLGVMFGVYVQWAIGSLVLFLFAVTLMMHRFWEESDMARMADKTNFYKNLALLGAALMLLAVQTPWVYSAF